MNFLSDLILFSVAIISSRGMEEYYHVLYVDAPDLLKSEIKRFLSEQGLVEFIPPVAPR